MLNLQDYQWQTIQEDDAVKIRMTNPHTKMGGWPESIGTAWQQFETIAQLNTYSTEGLEAGKVYEGEALEEVWEVQSWGGWEKDTSDSFDSFQHFSKYYKEMNWPTRQIIRLKVGEGK